MGHGTVYRALGQELHQGFYTHELTEFSEPSDQEVLSSQLIEKKSELGEGPSTAAG